MTILLFLHLISAFSSLSLLLIRGIMQMSGKNWREIKLLKILPHIADTVLLISGATLVFSQGYAIQIWLITKFALLILYAFASAKYFSKKTTRPNAVFLFIAILAFVGAMWLGYQH